MTSVTLLVAAFGWASGRHPAEAGVLFLSVAAPHLAVWAIPLLILRGVRSRREARSPAVLVLVALSSELQAGATLRGAVINVGAGDPRFSQAARLARAGRPMSLVFATASDELGRFGHIVTAALGMAATTGGSAAGVVDQLVAQIMSLEELDQERRSAMAPILLQAVIVGGVPLALLASMLASGRLIELAASGFVQATMVAVGSLLVLAGTAIVVGIARRAVRA